jgi:hypothetical protein
MSAAQPNTLSHSAGGQNSASNVGATSSASGGGGEGPPIQLSGLDSNQIISLLRHIPDLFGKVCDTSYAVQSPCICIYEIIHEMAPCFTTTRDCHASSRPPSHPQKPIIT